MQFNNINYYKKNKYNNIPKVNIPINIPKIENDKINNIPKSEIIVKPNIISNTMNITCKEEFRVFCSEYT